MYLTTNLSVDCIGLWNGPNLVSTEIVVSDFIKLLDCATMQFIVTHDKYTNVYCIHAIKKDAPDDVMPGITLSNLPTDIYVTNNSITVITKHAAVVYDIRKYCLSVSFTCFLDSHGFKILKRLGCMEQKASVMIDVCG